MDDEDGEKDDLIHILDHNQNPVAYEILASGEKEKVLSEILFTGALNKIQSEKNVNKNFLIFW